MNQKSRGFRRQRARERSERFYTAMVRLARLGSRVQVYDGRHWMRNGIIVKIGRAKGKEITVEIPGPPMQKICTTAAALWFHKTKARAKAKRRRGSARGKTVQEAVSPAPPPQRPPPMTEADSADATRCGLYGCTLPRLHRGICAIAVACHRRADAATCWVPLSAARPLPKPASAPSPVPVVPGLPPSHRVPRGAEPGHASDGSWSVSDDMSEDCGTNQPSRPRLVEEVPAALSSPEGTQAASDGLEDALAAASPLACATADLRHRAAASSSSDHPGPASTVVCSTPTTVAAGAQTQGDGAGAFCVAGSGAGSSSSTGSMSSSACSTSCAVGVEDAPLRLDPCDGLRSLAAAKGLTLEVYTGRRLPEWLGDEAVRLAEAHMGQMSGWDAKQRSADLFHPQTKVLVLRRIDAASSSSSALLSGDGPCGRATGAAFTAAPRASRQRANAPMSTPLLPADVRTRPSSVAGFASFRFVTQETLSVAYLFELHLSSAHRRQGIGSALLEAVRAHGQHARRDGMLLTVHLANATARAFYAARGFDVSPISPTVCAPEAVAHEGGYMILQSLWNEGAEGLMHARGEAARRSQQVVAAAASPMAALRAPGDAITNV